MAKSALFTVCNNESYPKYGIELAIRSGKHGSFLECSQYPACDYVHSLKSSTSGHIVKILRGQVCPAYGAGLVLRQGRFDVPTGHINYPEHEHIELIDKPDETTITCPQCRTGHLVRRRSCCGKTFHSCSRHPECQFATSFKPMAGEYPECHYPLLIEEKAAQGVEHFCANKQYGKPVSAE